MSGRKGRERQRDHRGEWGLPEWRCPGCGSWQHARRNYCRHCREPRHWEPAAGRGASSDAEVGGGGHGVSPAGAAAAPEPQRHGHGYLGLHGQELSWGSMVPSGRRWAAAGGGQRIGPYEPRWGIFRGQRFGLSPDGEGEGWIDRGVSSGGDRPAAESASTAEALEPVAGMGEREQQQPEAGHVEEGWPPQEFITPPHTPPWSSSGQRIEPGCVQLVRASQSESSDLEELELPTRDESEFDAAAVQSQEGWGASSTEQFQPMETPSGDSYYRGQLGPGLLEWWKQQESDRWELRRAPPGPPQLK